MNFPGETPGLEAVIRQGALRRRHSYVDLIWAGLAAAVAASIVAASIYAFYMLMAGRADWLNTAAVACAAALVPLLAYALLIVGARRTYPFTMALIAMAFAASFVVAVVSAARVPVSYQALFLTFPSSLFFVTLANVRMVRYLRSNVALLAFPGAETIIANAQWKVPIVSIDEVESRFHRILIDPEFHHSAEWAPKLARLYLRGFVIEAWPSYMESSLGKVDLATFDLADVSYSSSQILYYRLKRGLDLFGVMILALPAAVICALVALYILVIDGGPALFIQERRGYGGGTFRLYKFRTMYKGEHIGSTELGDSRILPGCGILRQLRLDELPQLFNILKGDMSFIGPRPVSVAVAQALEAQIPLYVNRQILLPGLTGWAQVSQGYAGTQSEEIEKLSFDLYYLKNVSMDLDIIIIFRTIRTVLMRYGAR